MSSQVFIVKEFRNPSFLQRVFRQYPEENVIIEINNILATHSILSITEERIKSITQKVSIDIFNTYKLNFVEFYTVYLNSCLATYIITDLQVRELAHLKNLFHLDTNFVQKIYIDFAGSVYRKKYEQAIKNRFLSEKEKYRLEILKTNLHLSDNLVFEIESASKRLIIQPYFNEVLNLASLSPSKEKEFNETVNNLQISIPIEVSSEIYNLKKYWAWENEVIQKIEIPHKLQKEEVCYFAISSKWYEFLAKSRYDTIKRYSLGQKFSVSKSGLTFRSVFDLKFADSGFLYLTNKRIIFVGTKNHNIKFEQIGTVGIYNNGIEIIKGTGRNVFLDISEDSQKFAIILRRIYVDNQLNMCK